MPHNQVFEPHELAELQRVYDDVTSRLADGGYRIPASEVSVAVMRVAAFANTLHPVALEANVYGRLTYDG